MDKSPSGQNKEKWPKFNFIGKKPLKLKFVE